MTDDQHIPGGEPHPSSIPPAPENNGEEEIVGVSLWADARRRLLKNKLAVTGVIIVAVVTMSTGFLV